MTGPLAMSVLGPVPIDELGVTLIHEHLHMDATPLLAVHGYSTRSHGPFDSAAAAEARWNPGFHPDNYRFIEDDLVARELAPYREAGGRTVVDLTPAALGRDPAALQYIARRSGLTVVMGAGHYLHATHGRDVRERDEKQLSDALIAEARDGVGDTGVRPGIIGEIGTSVPVHQDELKVLRAVASASAVSGLSVSIHLHPWGRTGMSVLDALLANGLAPERVVLGHLTTAHDDERYVRGLLDRGVFVAFDLFGFDHSLLGVGRWPPSDAEVAQTVVQLIGQGYGDRVLISQDIGVRTRLRAYGSWGYAHVLEHVVPLLQSEGLGDEDLHGLLVTNPARVLALETKPT
jgi:phosphotriesterase-related protein